VIPGAPGVPVGGDTGGAGVILRVVSRGFCACADLEVSSTKVPATTTSVRTAFALVKAPLNAHDERSCSGVELVVCVSLTHERTVYFTL
jgi:hypothetical protein